ncbi:phospholipase D/nuclease [Epithele typhae]|uniref:phospholipase D/nuclease n=1 Tax=Epithele typhae TaxID=378194 RepID=UPI0020078332|nr:phospholipase D/nuclease [Epithele typhae]KAH9911780.1 phospholipase D/nuclease [Epithele typhae]
MYEYLGHLYVLPSVSPDPAIESEEHSTQPPPPRPLVGGISPEERRQMEAERLARLKRTRPDLHKEASTIDLVDSDNEEYQEDEDDGGQQKQAKRQRISRLPSRAPPRRADHRPSASYSAAAGASAPSRAGPSTSTGRARMGVAGAGAGASSSGQRRFWDGELRQTGNMHVDPRKDTRSDFRLSDIISPKEEIEFAIVSAYVWDFSWVYQMFARSTPVIAVDHSQTGEASIKSILPNWIRTTPFLRGGRGCMHMKLFFRDRLRIMISTANLIQYDWRDIENVCDIRSFDPQHRRDPNAAEDFASAMVRVLHGVNVAPALVNLLRNDHPNLPLQRLEELRTHWDFSKVKVALIASIAGKHEGWPNVIQQGHTGLMKSVMDKGVKTPANKELMLECQGSSIGQYTTQWLNEFHTSACGVSAQTWLDGPKARRAKLPLPPVKIMFPTGRYVRESVLGEAGGGTMFCRRQQWEAANFPRQLFHETRSRRGKVLMHSKMVLGTFRDKRGTLDAAPAGSDGEDKPVGWLYMGSHNFTPSAWGTLSGSAFNPTLNITNYELGILMPLQNEAEVDRLTCWERPPKKYVAGQDEPWVRCRTSALGCP